MSNPNYLVHTGNGRVFPYSQALSKRKDMTPAADIDDANEKAKRYGGTPIEPKAHRLPNPPQNVVAPTTTPVDSKELADQKAENEQLRARLAEMEERLATQAGGSEAQTEGEGEDGDTFVISKASKDELEAFAKEEFGVDLDKRKKVEDLRAQVAELANKQTEGE